MKSQDLDCSIPQRQVRLIDVRASGLRCISGTFGLIGIIAICTSLFYFFHFTDFYTPDSSSYIESAANLAAGKGFKDANGYPETFRTPGYPLLIAPFLRFGFDFKWLILLQHLLRLTTALLTTALAFRISASRKQALIAGLVFCIDLPTLDVANKVLTETLFTVFLLPAFWLLWKGSKTKQESRKRSLLAGILAGASALIRPVAMFLFAPAMLYVLLIRKNLRSAALWSFAAGFACLPFLWSLRNYRETGYFTVSTVSGVDVLVWRAAGILASQDPGGVGANLEKRQSQLKSQVCDEIRQLRGGDCSRWSPTQTSEYYLHAGTKIVMQHKITYLKLAMTGAGHTLLGADAYRLAKILHVSYRAATVISLSLTLPCLFLGLTGLVRIWRTDRAFFFLSSLFVVYFVVLTAGVEGYSRYRVPVMPICAVLIAAGVGQLWPASRKKDGVASGAPIS